MKNATCRFRTEVAFFDIPCIPNGSDVADMPKGYIYLVFNQLLPDVVLCAAPADVRDGVAVDGHAAGCASEGEVAIVAENLVGINRILK